MSGETWQRITRNDMNSRTSIEATRRESNFCYLNRSSLPQSNVILNRDQAESCHKRRNCLNRSCINRSFTVHVPASYYVHVISPGLVSRDISHATARHTDVSSALASVLVRIILAFADAQYVFRLRQTYESPVAQCFMGLPLADKRCLCKCIATSEDRNARICSGDQSNQRRHMEPARKPLGLTLVAPAKKKKKNIGSQYPVGVFSSRV